MNLSFPELLLPALLVGGVVHLYAERRKGITKEFRKRPAKAIFIAALLAYLSCVWRMYELNNHGQVILTRPEALYLLGLETGAVALFGIGFWIDKREPANRSRGPIST